MNITPVIGERMRDTAREVAGIVHLDRFRATRAPRRDTERDAIREEYVMRALTRTAKNSGATLAQCDAAREAANTALASNRSLAWAIAQGKRHLPARKSPLK